MSTVPRDATRVSSLGIALATVATCVLAGRTLSIRFATREGLLNDIGRHARECHVSSHGGVSRSGFNAHVNGIPRACHRRQRRHAFFYARIKRVSGSRAEPIKASMPLYATIFAVILPSERVTGPHLVSIVLMMAGIALVPWEGIFGAREREADFVVRAFTPAGCGDLLRIRTHLRERQLQEGSKRRDRPGDQNDRRDDDVPPLSRLARADPAHN